MIAKKSVLTLIVTLLLCSVLFAQRRQEAPIRDHVLLDSIVLSDPAILADQNTKMYYMTGTGGML